MEVKEAFHHFDGYISMPHMSGFDATSHIREVEAGTGEKPTPILALTAHALADDEATCLQAGMDGYLSKPLSIQALEEKLVAFGVLSNTKKWQSKN